LLSLAPRPGSDRDLYVLAEDVDALEQDGIRL
jgi:hypothetical protein